MWWKPSPLGSEGLWARRAEVCAGDGHPWVGPQGRQRLVSLPCPLWFLDSDSWLGEDRAPCRALRQSTHSLLGSPPGPLGRATSWGRKHLKGHSTILRTCCFRTAGRGSARGCREGGPPPGFLCRGVRPSGGSSAVRLPRAGSGIRESTGGGLPVQPVVGPGRALGPEPFCTAPTYLASTMGVQECPSSSWWGRPSPWIAL